MPRMDLGVDTNRTSEVELVIPFCGQPYRCTILAGLPCADSRRTMPAQLPRSIQSWIQDWICQSCWSTVTGKWHAWFPLDKAAVRIRYRSLQAVDGGDTPVEMRFTPTPSM